MLISHLLKTDERVQEIILQLSQTLQPGECLFAHTRFGITTFRKVRDKTKFRKRFGEKVYITNQHLQSTKEVKVIGDVIRNMKREKLWTN